MRQALIAAAAVFFAVPAAATEIAVSMDQTSLVRLDRAAHTVVVGNPSIADASTQDGRTIFVQGKSFGVTNLIVLDAQGGEVMNARVVVQEAAGRQVTVWRGTARVTYACAPRCERTPVPGDAPEAFNDTNAQIAAKADLVHSAISGE